MTSTRAVGVDKLNNAGNTNGNKQQEERETNLTGCRERKDIYDFKYDTKSGFLYVGQ